MEQPHPRGRSPMNKRKEQEEGEGIEQAKDAKQSKEEKLEPESTKQSKLETLFTEMRKFASEHPEAEDNLANRIDSFAKDFMETFRRYSDQTKNKPVLPKFADAKVNQLEVTKAKNKAKFYFMEDDDKLLCKLSWDKDWEWANVKIVDHRGITVSFGSVTMDRSCDERIMRASGVFRGLAETAVDILEDLSSEIWQRCNYNTCSYE